MKKIAIGLLVLIAIVGGVAFLLFFNLDYFIKSEIEKYASAATGTKVTLDSADVELRSGDGKLSGLSVANPKGFSSHKAFYLGSIGVKLDTSTLRGSGPIVIESVTIEKPQVTYELLNNGDTNLAAIQKNAAAYVSSGSVPPPAKEPLATTTDAMTDNKSKPSRKIVINHLTIQDGQVLISQEVLKGQQLKAALPEITLSDLGQGSGGLPGSEIAEQIATAMTNAAAQAGLAELAKDKLNGLIKDVPAAAIGKGAVGAVNGGLKSIFGQ